MAERTDPSDPSGFSIELLLNQARTYLAFGEQLQPFSERFHETLNPEGDWGETVRLHFDQLKTALIGRRALEIVYCSSSGETNRLVILPHKLIFKDKGWYLQAYCRMAQDYRLFKVNRIVELTVLDEHFDDSPDDLPPLEPDYTIQQSFTKILLRFSKAIAFRIYDEFDRTSVEKQPDGSLLVTAFFPQDGWVIGYLHSFGTEVEILEPIEMRKLVASYAKAIWEHHRK